ncbi:hypothetical protein Thiowin_01569 [Thiorhodovibrio winogradskyi]|uniref:Uncharacterized protein n=1 Tax=Thiorhodovibrio winogradskyi TaxID=77007 RepID=A0ABZ0S934_9GAMM|nr:hypothetical protein [Thiorhodovibrio winogradskyi]
MPDALCEQVFERFFEVAKIANFTREELQSYEDSLKYYRDLKNSFDTARNLLDVLDDDTIARKTGLDSETIAALRKEG